MELMQRFEVRADAAYYTRVKVAKKPQRQWHGGEEGIARMRRLLDSGAHEVFLFNGVSPDVLPAALKQDLLARVARGKGLVRVGVKPRGRWNPPLENDPDRVALDEPLILDAPVARQVERGDPEAELFALKQGRAARLPAAPVTEYRFGWEIPDDHWQERLGRTVLWAAGKLPAQPLRLRRDPGTDAGMVAQSAPDARLMVTLPADMGIRPELWNHGFEPPRRCAPPLLVQGGENLQRQPECYGSIAQVRIRERRDDGLVVQDGILHSPPWLRRGGAERRGGSPIPAEKLEVTGPPAAGLPAGRYYDEVIATDDAGRVVAWATLPFVVALPQRVELELSRTWGEIGDVLAGRAFNQHPASGCAESREARPGGWRIPKRAVVG